MRQFLTSRINLIAISAGLCGLPMLSFASAFQLFEQWSAKDACADTVQSDES